MDTLDLLELAEKVNIENVCSTALQKNENKIADLNAYQLSRGKRSDGSDILPEYAPLTIELKKGNPGLSGVTDRVTLFDTGAHYKGLYADVQGVQIEYGSKDKKSAALEKKYATKRGGLYGLDEDSRDELISSSLQADTIEELEKLYNV